MLKNKLVIAILLVFSLLLVSCGGSPETSDNINSNENSAIISSIQTTHTQDELKEFPKIDETKLSKSSIKYYGGARTIMHYLGKANTINLAKFINDSKFEPMPKPQSYTVGCSFFIITFEYDDNSTVNYDIGSDYVCVEKNYFALQSSSIEDFISFVIGIDFYHKTVNDNDIKVKIAPEIESGLAHSTNSNNDHAVGSVFPKIAEENIDSVTILKRADKADATRVTLDDEKAKDLLILLNKNSNFVATDFTKEDFSYDYGDYYRLVFTYKDGSTFEFSYDGFFHTNLSSVYFKDKTHSFNNNLNLILRETLHPSDGRVYPVKYVNFPKISTANVSSCIVKYHSTKRTLSVAETKQLINYLNTCEFYEVDHSDPFHRTNDYSPYTITITYNDSSVVEIKSECCVTINTTSSYYHQNERSRYLIPHYLVEFFIAEQP